MNINFRQGSLDDLIALKELAILSWSQYKDVLEVEHWESLKGNLAKNEAYIKLLEQSECIVCETEDAKIIGMAFLVPNGNPTEIYQSDWSYIRFVSVNPNYGGKGIGRKLTELCIASARRNKEKIIALHTSEIMVKARKLYENLGFKIHKEIPSRLGKRYWLYLLELDNRA